jgi:flagellar hook assembly protein FlgD
LKENSTVNLEIYNVKGQVIKNLIKESYLTKGSHSVNWDGTNNNSKYVASGIYFYKISNADGVSNIKKCIVIK